MLQEMKQKMKNESAPLFSNSEWNLIGTQSSMCNDDILFGIGTMTLIKRKKGKN